MGRALVIGIAGGTGSGKTTVAEMIARELGRRRVAMLVQDNYYKDLAHLTFAERAAQNFDHPDAVDVELMAAHIAALREGRPIRVPTYDFATHSRRRKTNPMRPKRVIIVEGILVLAVEELRSLMDVKLYVDTDDDIRFIRRLRRDMVERKRSMESVVEQYLRTVRPMHHEFVERSKRWADLVLPWRDLNPAAVGMMIQMVRGFLRRRVPRAVGG
ncbi:MAG: uridine kinase [Deltaproteobacteria bacterium]|nr:uridine kinase [Deltaproteobacteria bacterium]